MRRRLAKLSYVADETGKFDWAVPDDNVRRTLELMDERRFSNTMVDLRYRAR